MCIIVVNKEGRDIAAPIIDKCVTNNPHGFGIYFLDDKRLHKTMDMDEARYMLASRRPYVAHCRYATVGEKTVDNVHPFEVQEDAFLFHNGTVRTRPEDTTKSDSWALAQLISRYDPMGDEVQHILEMTDSRFCIVKGNEFKLFNEDLWHEHDGVMYSKDNVLPSELVFVYEASLLKHDSYHTKFLTDAGEAYLENAYLYRLKSGTLVKGCMVHEKDKHVIEGCLFSGVTQYDLGNLDRFHAGARRTSVTVKDLDGNSLRAITWLYDFPTAESDWASHAMDFTPTYWHGNLNLPATSIDPFTKFCRETYDSRVPTTFTAQQTATWMETKKFNLERIVSYYTAKTGFTPTISQLNNKLIYMS